MPDTIVLVGLSGQRQVHRRRSRSPSAWAGRSSTSTRDIERRGGRRPGASSSTTRGEAAFRAARGGRRGARLRGRWRGHRHRRRRRHRPAQPLGAVARRRRRLARRARRGARSGAWLRHHEAAAPARGRRRGAPRGPARGSAPVLPRRRRPHRCHRRRRGRSIEAVIDGRRAGPADVASALRCRGAARPPHGPATPRASCSGDELDDATFDDILAPTSTGAPVVVADRRAAAALPELMAALPQRRAQLRIAGGRAAEAAAHRREAARGGQRAWAPSAAMPGSASAAA